MKRKLIGCAVLAFALLGGVKQGFARPGDLDTRFGNNGIVIDNQPCDYLACSNQPTAVAVQNDRKVLVTVLQWGNDVDSSGGTPVRSLLIRYNENGSRDTAFGSSGIIDLGNRGGKYDEMIHIQPDQRIIIITSDRIIRFNPDGTYDSNFGGVQNFV